MPRQWIEDACGPGWWTVRQPRRAAGRTAIIVVLILMPVVASLLIWQTRRAGIPALDPRQMNLLLITLDTTRADYLGCYGRGGGRTPNLDRLAREGVRFEHCVTASPLTLPSHATIMTGLFPQVHGARRNGPHWLSLQNTTLAERLGDAGFITCGIAAAFVLDRQFGIAQGFDVYSDVPARSAATNAPVHVERRAPAQVSEAMQALQAMAGRRFFLWVHFFDPHHPYESERTTDTHSADAYADEIAKMDAGVGSLLEGLAGLGLSHNTLTVVVGDHGEGLGEHHERVHSFFLYDTTLQVPFILHAPGLLGSATVPATVRTVDIVPTVMDLLGMPVPEGLQGVSLQPFISGTADDLHLAAYAETWEPNAVFGFAPLRSLTLDGWKYVHAPRRELYHLAEDPHETRDLSRAHPERTASMEARLEALLADSPPPVTPGESPLDLSGQATARLRALGYAGAGATPGRVQELDLLEPVGADMKDAPDLLVLHARSQGAMLAGRLEESEDLLQQVLARAPQAIGPLVELAEVLDKQGRHDDAAQAYRQALQLAPGDQRTRWLYGELMRRLGRMTEAEAAYRQVLEATPDDVQVRYSLAVVLGMTGRLPEARREFAEALRREPDNLLVLHGTAMASARAGDFAEAEKHLMHLLELEPGNAHVIALLEDVQRQQGR